MTQTTSKQTSPSATPPAPTPRADTPRADVSLGQWEGAMAFGAAAGAWYMLTALAAPDRSKPVWLLFVFCNLVAVSALSARRFVRRDATRSVSRIGYAALGFPFAQALLFLVVLLALGNYFTLPLRQPLGGAFLSLIAVSLPAHFALSVAAIENGVRHKDSRGDIAAAPLFVAWYLEIFLLIALQTADA